MRPAASSRHCFIDRLVAGSLALLIAGISQVHPLLQHHPAVEHDSEPVDTLHDHVLVLPYQVAHHHHGESPQDQSHHHFKLHLLSDRPVVRTSGARVPATDLHPSLPVQSYYLPTPVACNRDLQFPKPSPSGRSVAFPPPARAPPLTS